MARPGPQTFAKRQREIAKQEKRRAKAEKMALRRAQKKLTATGGGPPIEAESTEEHGSEEHGNEDRTKEEEE